MSAPILFNQIDLTALVQDHAMKVPLEPVGSFLPGPVYLFTSLTLWSFTEALTKQILAINNAAAHRDWGIK